MIILGHGIRSEMQKCLICSRRKLSDPQIDFPPFERRRETIFLAGSGKDTSGIRLDGLRRESGGEHILPQISAFAL
jgi:hypothetical protein